MSDWKECRNYENCGCYCIYPEEEAGLCQNCLDEHDEDGRLAELAGLRSDLAASREREARVRAIALSALNTNSRDREDWRDDMRRIADTALAASPVNADGQEELDPVFLASYISEREDWPGREVLVGRIERALALRSRAKR